MSSASIALQSTPYYKELNNDGFKKKKKIMTKKCLINYPLCLYAQAFIGAINEKMCITEVSRD